MNDHRRVEWRNFPIEELGEIFPSTVKRIEACGSLFNRHLIRDPIGSRRIPIVVVNHLKAGFSADQELWTAPTSALVATGARCRRRPHPGGGCSTPSCGSSCGSSCGGGGGD